ncbi:SAM-dependent methyltransferase [Blastopirellula marina]|uniref:SAM-dependent methyltransferase n=1 Tax=Blastopirellula marina TaxID=124 RepID=A0A2S8GE21_9BACT|nr:class I SAM-dependent methyltransferase [Blastopirellula marina]PQO42712.1 SAM-dependent methyltransferase [Blastopirellula marina]PTL46478.1 class I SAM-dependent methyltransferase [Blastopirellula marina]
MPQIDPEAVFNQACAAGYDRQWVEMAPLRDAIHLLLRGIFLDLPKQARILCVGAGTGAEMLYLAQHYPDFHFVAVEPSRHMLEVCQAKATDAGIADRCEFHVGYLDTYRNTQPFDAATSLLVSQFLLDRDVRTDYFRQIGQRLRPGGYLVSSDLSANTNSTEYERLLQIWMRTLQLGGVSQEATQKMREAYANDVAVLPPAEVSQMIASAGFAEPTCFYQVGLVHAWHAIRN